MAAVARLAGRRSFSVCLGFAAASSLSHVTNHSSNTQDHTHCRGAADCFSLSPLTPASRSRPTSTPRSPRTSQLDTAHTHTHTRRRTHRSPRSARGCEHTNPLLYYVLANQGQTSLYCSHQRAQGRACAGARTPDEHRLYVEPLSRASCEV